MKPAGRAAWTLLIPLGIFVMAGAIGTSEKGISSGSGEKGVAHDPAPTVPTCLAEAGVQADWWGQVVREIESLEYQASWTDRGLQAPNRAHNFRVHFEQGGVKVTPRTDPADAWSWSWRTIAWGRTGMLRSVAPTTPTCAGPRVMYDREDLIEWYDNDERGLEQGFTIPLRPPGEGQLTITGKTSTHVKSGASLCGLSRSDGRAIDFCAPPGGAVLSYGDLVVRDTRDATLTARLVMDEDQIAIVIDDTDAVYPITVDPILRASPWELECEFGNTIFGFAVATAGDVNGDGYSDVLVGAPNYDHGETDEGCAFLYLGSPDGPDPAVAWSAESNTSGAFLGKSVATAGDVNDDGYDDLLVGSPDYDWTYVNSGVAYAWYGSASGMGPNGTPGNADWQILGGQDDSQLGHSLATAGDVNGDGYDDVILGGPGFDHGQGDEGYVWVCLGSASGLSTPSWTAEGDQTYCRLGFSVSTAGDVNADGYDDVIAGADLYDAGIADEGAAFLWLGSATGLGPSGTPSNADWTGRGNQAGSHYGRSVSIAGDVNGDGYCDVVVGAPEHDNGEANEGRAYVYFGRSTGLASVAGWQWEPDEGNAKFGFSVSTAGDCNGDGYADILVGAPALDPPIGPVDAGTALIFYGSQVGLLPDYQKWLAGEESGSNAGYSVATAGDVNGDGLSDVIVGAPFYNGTNGRATVYQGWWSSPLTFGPPNWTAESNQADARYGSAVAPAGDINGDGYSDVIVGAPFFDSGLTDEGCAFIYLGSDTGLDTAHHWRGQGAQTNAQYGTAVGCAGDVNGDGYDDILVGVPLYDNGQTDEGIAVLYYGSETGLPPTGSPANADWWTQMNQADAHLGYLVGTAGDVNGDGFGDIIVGAPHYDDAVSNQGLVLVWHGSASGPTPGIDPASADWSASSNTSMAQFGYSGGTAGDVNGDGFSDVLVGAYNMSHGQATEGMAFAWYGSASGLGPAGDPSNADWTGESDFANARFGYSLGTAGDTNGDGYSDIIVGAYSYDDGSETGGAYVYFGGASGLTSTPGWVMHLATTESWNFGYAVSTAGNINGDGYSDILVGANLLTDGETNEGGAYAYWGSPTGPQGGPAWFDSADQAGAWFGVAVAGIGDVNGDGFGDIAIGASRYDHGQTNEGTVSLYYGNWSDGTLGDGILKLPRQARSDDTAPIALLGSSGHATTFRAKLWGRTPAGRGMVRLEWEVKPVGTAFDETGLGQSLSEYDTGAPVAGVGSRFLLNQLIHDLTQDTAYHWRARTITESPFFPQSLWFHVPGNGPGETDFRTAEAPSSVESAGLEGSTLRLDPPFPNPAGPHTALSYSLPREGIVRVSVHDVAGRCVAILAAGPREAGSHLVVWDGLDARGAAVPSGTYFVVLTCGEENTSQRFTLMR